MRRTPLTLLLASLFVLTSCFGKPPIQRDGPFETRVTAGGNVVGEVEVQLHALDNRFDPIRVEVDDTRYVHVKVSNRGSNVHTVTIPALGIDTKKMEPGYEKTLIFPAPARDVRFFCKIHRDAGMVGRIVSN